MGSWNRFFKFILFATLGASLSGCGVFHISDVDSVSVTPDISGPTSAFGKSGVVKTNFARTGDTGDDPVDIAVSDAGTIFILGNNDSGVQHQEFFLSSLDSAGGLDTDFGVDGFISGSLRQGSANYTARMAIVNNKIVVGAQSRWIGHSEDMMVARYNLDGTPDTTFNSSGMAYVDVSGNEDYVTDMAVQADGKIILVGFGSSGTGDQFQIARFNADGSIDTTFNASGTARLEVEAGYTAEAWAVAVQTNDQILVSGFSRNVTNRAAIVRYNTDGTLDATFGTGGVSTYALPAGSVSVKSMALQSDGKIILVGERASDFVVLRFDSVGALDTSFNGLGYAVLDLLGTGTDDKAYSVRVQSDGKILVGGSSQDANADFAVVRYNADGTLDTSFNTTGILVFASAPNAEDGITSMTVQADGKILLVGWAYDTVTSVASSSIVRLNANGSFDTTFNTTGKKLLNMGRGSSDSARAMAKQSDGKIVVAGNSKASQTDLALARYNADGTLDGTFGADGKVVIDFNSGDPTEATAVQVLASGKIVVAVNVEVGGMPQIGVAQFLANGQLDTAFNTTGKLLTGFGPVASWSNFLKVQEDGKLVVGGSYFDADAEFAVMRLNADGSLDTSFNTTGIAISTFSAGWDAAYDGVIQADGKIVLAGEVAITGTAHIGLTRYNADGSLDTSFGTLGIVQGDVLGNGASDLVNSLILKDGKLVAAGSGFDANQFGFVAQYNLDGTLDTGFSTTGIKVLTIASADLDLRKVEASPDGKLLIGISGGAADLASFSSMRLNGDGSIDTTFNGGQMLTQSFGQGTNSNFYASLLLDDGTLLVGGDVDSSGQPDFTLVRFTESGVQ